MTITRRKFTRSAIAATSFAVTSFGILKSPSQAATTLKFGINAPRTHAMAVRLMEAGAAIKQESNGAVDIQFFPDSQLGGDQEVLTQLRAGAIHFYTLGGEQVASFSPTAAITSLGFAFETIDQVWAAVDGDIGRVIRQGLADRGLMAFEKAFDNGYRQVTSTSRPIQAPEDLNGLLIRVPPAPISVSLFKAFGASPHAISFGELYTALRTKLVDAQENALVLIELAKLYEVQKHLSLTNHMWGGFWALANKAAWDKLPADQRALIDRKFQEAAVAQRVDVAKANEGALQRLQAAGLTVTKPDTSLFRKKLASTNFYSEWRKNFGNEAWQLLEKYSGSLG